MVHNPPTRGTSVHNHGDGTLPGQGSKCNDSAESEQNGRKEKHGIKPPSSIPSRAVGANRVLKSSHQRERGQPSDRLRHVHRTVSLRASSDSGVQEASMPWRNVSEPKCFLKQQKKRILKTTPYNQSEQRQQCSCQLHHSLMRKNSKFSFSTSSFSHLDATKRENMHMFTQIR